MNASLVTQVGQFCSQALLQEGEIRDDDLAELLARPPQELAFQVAQVFLVQIARQRALEAYRDPRHV